MRLRDFAFLPSANALVPRGSYYFVAYPDLDSVLVRRALGMLNYFAHNMSDLDQVKVEGVSDTAGTVVVVVM